MREISLLRQLVTYPQFVQLWDILEEETGGQRMIYCIFEFCDKVLSQELNRRQGPLNIDLTRKYIKDLLEAIDILHGKMIMHRDIKPDNILIDKGGKLKLADFGLAKKASFLQRRKSNAIVSLWYRAPEIILGSEDYFLGVDIWSIGCILAECLNKKPIFMCRNENEVLHKVFHYLGTPSQTHCPAIAKLKKFANAKEKWPQFAAPGSLKKSFPGAPEDALDLLSKLLCLDPNNRLLAKQALQHPFFTNATKNSRSHSTGYM
jgi:serine/threonine protein kinase